jgi:hypothetical protein
VRAKARKRKHLLVVAVDHLNVGIFIAARVLLTTAILLIITRHHSPFLLGLGSVCRAATATLVPRHRRGAPPSDVLLVGQLLQAAVQVQGLAAPVGCSASMY